VYLPTDHEATGKPLPNPFEIHGQIAPSFQAFSTNQAEARQMAMAVTAEFVAPNAWLAP
jgi:hypothetical protein